MLDSVTKRRIDTCRDILVGKIPDPKSQVEQITIALIYKFMDDMDLDSEALGGKRKFFTGEFERYAWGKLIAPGTSGQDMLNTYAEALQRMTENEKLPALFRDIFRNAYLPYRDPETLRSFLREINGFTYDHSERLGDAFEYLLSVLGSQGDAGQFRTPRHIIDFMVAVIDPRKDEVILDPACGTAGFLISSYKHILKANSSVVETNGNGEGESALERPIESPLRFSGDLLTNEDRQRLARNIKGYDISPDMVRLSLVNLYLHGFAYPRVEEYDTLTSEDKWSEMADVILANPPFMSPKGGIRPHNRFSVAATRSEVLFVDYIAEHLTPKGRAAVIVPEGVIFQSGSAYKALRKMLVDNFLVAVVSLPAGVFNPYSGVKTSILIFDRSAAKASDTVGFFKIANDGFNLGAQRRPVGGSELPDVLAEIAEYRAHEGEDAWDGRFGRAVAKAEIAATGDYNLSSERYRPGRHYDHEYPLVSLGDETLFRVEGGGTPKSDVVEYWNGDVQWATLVDLPAGDFVTQIYRTQRSITERGLRESAAKQLPPNSVIVSTRATIGRIAINRVPVATNQGFKNIIIRDEQKVLPEFVAFMVKRLVPTMQALATGGTFAELSKTRFCELEVPLPPLDAQREIVGEIEGYQKVIDGARTVLENYRPHITIDPAWPVARLAEICEFKNGLNFSSDAAGHRIKVLGVSDFKDRLEIGTEGLASVTIDRAVGEDYLLKAGDLLFVRSNGNPELVGRSIIVSDASAPATFSGFTIRARVTEKRASPLFLAHLFKSGELAKRMKTVGRGANIRNLSQSILAELEVPLPPLETQRLIIAELEAERALVGANQQLVERMEAKIEAAVGRVWGAVEVATPEEVVA